MTSYPNPTSFHIGVAAEAFAAALFARCGCDVSVQYGANQPEYDLIIARGGALVQVSVKGSQDGRWGLTQSFKAGRTYHQAIDFWLARHGAKTIFCLVQFKDVELHELPRVYLARPIEIAERMKQTAGGEGYTVLYERKVWTARSKSAGSEDAIPDAWRFSEARLSELLQAT